MSDLITPQNGLKTDLKKTQIRDKIIIQINSFENIESYKLDPEFISLVANLIEHYVKTKYGIDKKSLLLDIFNKIFPNVSEEDKTIILKNLQYIYDNEKINKVSYTKFFTSCFGQWLQKKIL
jgi:protoheme ferro-lyase